MNTYLIFLQIVPGTSKPYCIGEVVMTLDGPRTRFVRGGFKNMEAAQAWLDEKVKTVRGEGSHAS